MQRIGVFVCHCGSNIAATVDVKKVVELAAKEPGVVHAEDYQYIPVPRVCMRLPLERQHRKRD